MTDVLELGRARVAAFTISRGATIAPERKRPSEYFVLDGKARLSPGQHDDACDPTARPGDDRLHIGVIRLGGIGDDLTLAANVTAIKRRFPHAHITAFVRDNTGILAGHPAFDRLVFRTRDWSGVVRDLRERFDIFYDLRYVAKVWALHPDYREYGEQCRAAFEPRAWYYSNRTSVGSDEQNANWFPTCRQLADLGQHVVDITNAATRCPGGVQDVRLQLRAEDRKLAAMMAGRPYATIHNGCGGGVTKLWPPAHWGDVVESLRETGLAVIQIGGAPRGDAHDVLISGATHDLRGLSTLRETAGLLAGAAVCVDTEGGMVHLAHAVGQRRVVVLYGPTPQVCFGYPGHVPVVTPLECRGCWYQHVAWFEGCPREADTRDRTKLATIPACMHYIAPERVLEAVAALVQRDEPPTMELPASATVIPGVVHVRTRREAPGLPAQRTLLPITVAIPTRNRPEFLARLLDSLVAQDAIPHEVIVVDDNDAPDQVPDSWSGQLLTVLRGRREGPARSHQIALEAASQPWILRLDDDMAPESPDFLSRLYALATSADDIAAVGGVYPQPRSGAPRRVEDIGRPGLPITVDAMLREGGSAQWYRYDRAATIEAEHLNSSFLYRRDMALAAGGHAVWYSPVGFREETDFSLRLRLGGRRLLFDTGAVARHEQAATGGIRDVVAEHRVRMDNELFMARLAEGKLGEQYRGIQEVAA